MNLITFVIFMMLGYVVGFVFDDHPMVLMLGALLCGVVGMILWSMVS